MSSPERNPNPEEPRSSETPTSRGQRWRSAALRADHQVRSAVDRLRPAAHRANERIVALILWLKQSLAALFGRPGATDSTDASRSTRLSGLAPSASNTEMRSRHALRTEKDQVRPSRLRSMQAGAVVAAVGVVGVVIGAASTPQGDSTVEDAAHVEAQGSTNPQNQAAPNGPQSSGESGNDAAKPKHGAQSPEAIGSPRPEARTGDEKAGAMSKGNQNQPKSAAAQAQAGMNIPDNADGIDVSNHNGSVDWGQVAADGQKFTFVLATDGESFTSSTFNEQYQGAKDAGLMAGAYHFGRPSGSATGQADRLLQTTGGYQNDGKTLPPVLDLEVDPNTGGCYGKSAAGMHEWTQEFISHIKGETGKDPIIYASPSFWQNCMDSSGAFSNNPLWLASYGVDDPKVPGGWDEYTFWQYSETGSVDGVSGPVDTNKFQGTGEDLKRLAR